MTTLPDRAEKKLGLVIDPDVRVGRHACAVGCKEWNTGGHGAALSDRDGRHDLRARTGKAEDGPALSQPRVDPQASPVGTGDDDVAWGADWEPERPR